MAAWIDFRELRSKLSFERVLQFYKVEIKAKSRQHHGFCPLPTHNGKRNSPSFSANLEKGIFQCFGCGAKGNVLDFAVRMNGLDPENGEHVRQVGLKLQKEFGITTEKPATEKKPEPKPEPELALKAVPEKRIVVNVPLNFELKRLDPAHPYLDVRGFNRETVERFGLGFCAKGFLAGRIAIPLHSLDGQLLGYAGRIVDDKLICEEHPRYKFPPPREREGAQYEFHKLKILYNAHRIVKPVKDLIVVEGFPSVWWLYQMGFSNVGALMGWVCSDEQAEIITDLVMPDGHVWLISDGDESGVRCAQEVLARVALKRFVRRIKLDDGKQPTDYPAQFFREALA